VGLGDACVEFLLVEDVVTGEVDLPLVDGVHLGCFEVDANEAGEGVLFVGSERLDAFDFVVLRGLVELDEEGREVNGRLVFK